MVEPTCDCAKCRYDFYRARMTQLHAEITFAEIRAKKAAEDVLNDKDLKDEYKDEARKFLEGHKHLERTTGDVHQIADGSHS